MRKAKKSIQNYLYNLEQKYHCITPIIILCFYASIWKIAEIEKFTISEKENVLFPGLYSEAQILAGRRSAHVRAGVSRAAHWRPRYQSDSPAVSGGALRRTTQAHHQNRPAYLRSNCPEISRHSFSSVGGC